MDPGMEDVLCLPLEVEQGSFVVVGLGKENKCKGQWGSVGSPAGAVGAGAAASALGPALVGEDF